MEIADFFQILVMRQWMWISCEFQCNILEKKRATRLLSLVLYVAMVSNRITRPLPLGLKKSKTEPSVHWSLKKKALNACSYCGR